MIHKPGRGRTVRVRQPQLAGAHPGQEQQPDAKLGLPATGVVEPELLEELGQLGQVQVGVVGHRGLGLGHHVQVGGRIDFQPLGDDQGIAEQLVEPGADLLGGGERLAFLDRRQDAQELGPANVVDRHLPRVGSTSLLKMQDLRQRALTAFLEFLAAMLDPGIEDGLEGVFARQLGRVPFWSRSTWGSIPLAAGPGPCRARSGLAQADQDSRPGTCAFACPASSSGIATTCRLRETIRPRQSLSERV
jgi:hypothetical protein